MKSPNFQFDTDRQHDVSLARLLKNWSNRYTPPEDSRQKLLDAAAAIQPTIQKRQIWNLFTTFVSWLIHGSYEYNWSLFEHDPKFAFSGSRRDEKSYSMMIFLYATRAASVSSV